VILVKQKGRTVIVGIGNPIRGDDGVAIRLVRKLREMLPQRFEVKESVTAGLELMEAILGYGRAILIDAIRTPEGVPGEVYRFDWQDSGRPFYVPFSHAINLREAVEMGAILGGEQMPAVEVLAVEAKRLDGFCEDLSPELEEKLDQIAAEVRAAIEGID
jgi:hydrogenase maturation protease